MLLGFFEVIGSQIEFTNVFIRTLMTRIQFQCLIVIEKGLFQQIQFGDCIPSNYRYPLYLWSFWRPALNI